MRVQRKGIVSFILALLMFITLLTPSLGENEPWDCPQCGETGNTGNYCGVCAHPAPWLSADPMSGEKDGTVKVSVALNDADLNGRSASIAIQAEAYGLSKSLTLSQEAAITSRVTDSLALVRI